MNGLLHREISRNEKNPFLSWGHLGHVSAGGSKSPSDKLPRGLFSTMVSHPCNGWG